MTSLGFSQTIMDILSSAYKNEVFVSNLKTVKTKMMEALTASKLAVEAENALVVPDYSNPHDRHKISSASLSPQFDDIEAEIMCLLIMHFESKHIYEMSPSHGWSTLYMLNTVDVSNMDSIVHSYDTEDTCVANINGFPNLATKFDFHLGDVKNEYVNFSDQLDFVFIDCDCSVDFAKDYIANLLTPLLEKAKLQNKKTIVCIHDIFHNETPSSEGEFVIEFITQNNLQYFSPKNNEHSQILAGLRSDVGIDTELIHHATSNPAIFFILE